MLYSIFNIIQKIVLTSMSTLVKLVFIEDTYRIFMIHEAVCCASIIFLSLCLFISSSMYSSLYGIALVEYD